MLLVPFDESRRVYGGLDLAETDDLTSFCAVQWTEDRGFKANWRFWLPEEKLDRQFADAVNYRQWSEKGYLTVIDGKRIRQDVVAQDIITWCLEYDIGMIGYDPWGAGWISKHLDKHGIFTQIVRQGFAHMSEPSKLLESCVASGTFLHGGNPIARWNAENVEITSDPGGNIRPVKSSSKTKRIDGIVAAVMAIAVAIEQPEIQSSYDGGLAL